MFPNEQTLWTIARMRHQEKIERAEQLMLLEMDRSAQGGQWRQLTGKAGGWLVEALEALMANQPGAGLADEKR